MIRSCTPAIVGMALFGSVSVVPAEPLPTETFKVLPAALAVEAAQAAIAACKTQGYAISVAVVDRTGDLKLLLVGDGAGALTPSLSRRKGYTAAMRRTSTAELAKQVAVPGAFNPTLYDRQLVAVGGGVPIKVGDEIIGGIGVGGAPTGEKDEACANAVRGRVSKQTH